MGSPIKGSRVVRSLTYGSTGRDRFLDGAFLWDDVLFCGEVLFCGAALFWDEAPLRGEAFFLVDAFFWVGASLSGDAFPWVEGLPWVEGVPWVEGLPWVEACLRGPARLLEGDEAGLWFESRLPLDGEGLRLCDPGRCFGASVGPLANLVCNFREDSMRFES